ncbi:ankyrin repeat-containing domain protein [Neocallimastix lanati (nom. inval.)]|nr:ankyrin repeat-containing domain protein [Neocallimastix sp. JGI-2020a]
MNFENFMEELFIDLKNNDKNCLKKLEENENFIKKNLNSNDLHNVIIKFIENINNIISNNENRFNLIEKFLKHSTVTNIFNLWKNSDVLLKACKAGNKNACKWLLDMDINSRVQDDEGKTALMYAIENPSLLSIVKRLIVKNDCLNILDNNHNNALYYALHNTNALMELLHSEINVNNLNKDNETVLIYCCKNNIYEPIEFLTLNKNLNVNLTDNYNKTAAMYLAEKGRYKEIKSLNKQNCDYNYINKEGKSILSIVIDKIYKSNENLDIGISNYFRIITSLVHMNANFCIPVDEDGNTAIMAFMLVNDFDTFCYVMKYSKCIDLSVKNNYGENACSLSLKLKTGSPYFHRLLKHNTFDFAYIDDNNNNTLLMLASMTIPKCIKEIIEYDINKINNLNNKNENALILATKCNLLESIKILISNGININQQDSYGNTALYYAVDIGNLQIITILICNKADFNIKNNNGISALDHAKELNDENILHAIFQQYSLPPLSDVDVKNELPIKYNEILQYLNPLIKVDYSKVHMTKSLIGIEKSIYKTLKNDFDIHYDYESYSTKPAYYYTLH